MGTLLQSQTRVLLDARNRSKITRALIGTNPLSPAWYAPTWVTAGGVLVNAPTLGAELHVEANAASDPNGNEDNATTGWLAAGGTLSSVAVPSVGTYALKELSSGSSSDRMQYSPTLIASAWYLLTLASKYTVKVGSYGQIFNWANVTPNPIVPVTNIYANYAIGFRATSTAPIIRIYPGTIANDDIFADNVSLKRITLAHTFSTINARLSNFNLVAPAISTFTTGTQAGVVLCLDSQTNPQNFVIAYCDGAGNVKIEKCVAGVYTTLSTVASAWGAAKFFSAKKNGSSISIYYGATAFTTLIATVTVSDAAIVNNTRHGLFSTYSGNQFAGLFKVSPYAA